jgi:hypothetical protein
VQNNHNRMEYKKILNKERNGRLKAFELFEARLHMISTITADFSSLFKDGRVVVHYSLYDEVINRNGPTNVKLIRATNDFVLLLKDNGTVFRYCKQTQVTLQLPYENCDLLEATRNHYYIQGVRANSSICKVHVDGSDVNNQLGTIEASLNLLFQLGKIDQLSLGEQPQ